MDYQKAVELYTGISDIDMIDIVRIEDGVLINWGLIDIPEPTIEQLETIWNDNQVGIERIKVLQILIISAGNTIQQTLRQNTYDVLGEFIANIISNAENEIKTIEENYIK